MHHLRLWVLGLSMASGLALPLAAVGQPDAIAQSLSPSSQQSPQSPDLSLLPPPPVLGMPGPRQPGAALRPSPVPRRSFVPLAPDLSQLPPPPTLVEPSEPREQTGSNPYLRNESPTSPAVSPAVSPESCPAAEADAPLELTLSSPYLPMLRRTWVAYRDRFITPEGYVIDYQAEDDRTTSEGQAYAMLRAVLINDREAFDRTFNWAEENLARSTDSLWAWKWLPGTGIKDSAFASDADIDAITALIFAARRWDCPAYLAIARQKLDDLWRYSTVEANGNRYLLPGPAAAFYQTPEELILNPSYFAPYAYRMFAQVDERHDWMKLVADSYEALEAIAAVSAQGLPGDWIQLDTTTGEFGPVTEARQNIRSVYSFDAFRVWWRIGLDAAWFNAPEAQAYLRQNLRFLAELWQRDQQIPGILSLEGEAQVPWETTSHYAALYPAFKQVDGDIAFEIFTQKLLKQYQGGFWENNSAYYAQNLAWFSLLPQQPLRTLVEPPSR